MNLYSIDDKGNLIELSELVFENHDVYLIDDIDKKCLYIWVGLDVPQYKKDLTAAWARRFDKDRGGSCKILIMMQKREYGSFLSMMDQLKKGLIPGKSAERRPELILSAPGEEPSYEPKEEITELKEEKVEIKEDKIEITEDNVELGTVAWLNQLREYRKPVTHTIIEDPTPLEEEPEEAIPSEEDIQEPDFEEEAGLESQIREAAYYLSLKRYSYNDLCWLLAETIQNVNIEMPSLEDIRKKAEEVFNSSSTYDELCWLNAEMDILIEQQFLEKKKKFN